MTLDKCLSWANNYLQYLYQPVPSRKAMKLLLYEDVFQLIKITCHYSGWNDIPLLSRILEYLVPDDPTVWGALAGVSSMSLGVGFEKLKAHAISG